MAIFKSSSVIVFLTVATASFQFGQCWNIKASSSTSSLATRRRAIATAASNLIAFPSLIAQAADDTTTTTDGGGGVFTKYESRDRFSNKGAIVREDYYYMMGTTPPRSLGGPLRLDDPEWNAFGSCTTKEGDGSSTNSCTYVSLKQRIPTYSKYGFSISLGAKEYNMLRKSIEANDWDTSSSFLKTYPQTPPPPAVDALLKMVLFASGMLTSPNYSGPSKELLVARFYVNEVSFAIKEIAAAVDVRDKQRALAAWDFGKDSWNSYFNIVNDKVSSKVGDKFELFA